MDTKIKIFQPSVIYSILWLLGLTVICNAVIYDDSHEEVLRSHLFSYYDKQTRPSETTEVSFRLTIKHFEMIEQSQSLTVDTWMVNQWDDPRLPWDPEAYGGIQKITVPEDMIWRPDLGIYNSANLGEDMTFSNNLVLLYHNGRIQFLPAVQLHFTCVMDLTMWPHDTHKCTCIIASWMHDGWAISLNLLDDEPQLDMPIRFTEDGVNITRGSWNLLHSSLSLETKNYSCCEEPYVSIHMVMVVERNAPAYKWIVKGPAIGLSILTMVLFMLPPAAGEKMIFGLLCLLLDFIYIAFTSYTISLAPSHLPLIVKMICKQSMLVIGSIVVGALSLRLARDPHTTGLPSWIKKPVLVLSHCMCLQSYKLLVSRVHHHKYSPAMKSDEFELKENGNGHMYTAEANSCPGFDWLLLAAFIDRVCLIIYAIIFTVYMYSYSAIL